MHQNDEGEMHGKGRPRNENQREVALDLLSAAEQKIFLKGYRDITSREIAELAGTNQAMISYYYDCKDGLFSTVIENELRAKAQKFRSVRA